MAVLEKSDGWRFTPDEMMTEVKIGRTFAPWGNQFSRIPLRSH